MTNLHLKFNMPKDILVKLILEATGKEAELFNRIVQGVDNEVYSVITKDGKQFIIRINRRGSAGFTNEAWAMNECRKNGVPVPEIYFIGTIEYDDEKIEVMIEEKIIGKSINDTWDSLNLNDRDKLLRQSGEALSKIHKTKVNGYWRRQCDGNWSFDSWEAISLSNIRNRIAEEKYIVDCGFNKAEFTFMIDMLNLLREKYPCIEPVLCHGDYKLDHIFIDESFNISGIIDFGDNQGGSVFADIASFSTQHPDIDLNIFLNGYFNTKVIPKDVYIQLNLHKLSFQIGLLAHCVRIADRHRADYVKGELSKTITMVKSS